MLIKTIFFAVLIVIPIKFFLVEPYRVPDNSMSPGMRKGDIVLINKFSSFGASYKRNDIILLRDSNDPAHKALRRVIGLPTEQITVNDGILKIKGEKEITRELPLFGSIVSSLKDKGALDAHEYFIASNTDLEVPIGMIDERFILGKPFMKVWPPKFI
jgi:signal peptidase I